MPAKEQTPQVGHVRPDDAPQFRIRQEAAFMWLWPGANEIPNGHVHRAILDSCRDNAGGIKIHTSISFSMRIAIGVRASFIMPYTIRTRRPRHIPPTYIVSTQYTVMTIPMTGDIPNSIPLLYAERSTVPTMSSLKKSPQIGHVRPDDASQFRIRQDSCGSWLRQCANKIPYGIRCGLNGS